MQAPPHREPLSKAAGRRLWRIRQGRASAGGGFGPRGPSGRIFINWACSNEFTYAVELLTCFWRLSSLSLRKLLNLFAFFAETMYLWLLRPRLNRGLFRAGLVIGKEAILYDFTRALIQSRKTLRGPTEAFAKAGVAEQVPRLLWRLGNPSELDCAHLRPQLGVGQACKRGEAASTTTDGDVKTFANPIRCKVIYSNQ